MNKCLLIPVFLLSIITNAYSKNNTHQKYKNIFINAYFSPDYSYRRLTTIKNTYDKSSWKEANRLMDSVFKPRFGYSAGINLGYCFNKRFEAELGVCYARRGYKLIPWRIYDLDKNISYFAEVKYSYIFLEFPLLFNYSLPVESFNIIATGGVLTDFLIGETRYFRPVNKQDNAYKGRSPSGDGIKKNWINFSPIVGVGIRKRIGNSFAIQVQPNFAYAIKADYTIYYPIAKFGVQKTEHLWKAGINISCNVKFK